MSRSALKNEKFTGNGREMTRPSVLLVTGKRKDVFFVRKLWITLLLLLCLTTLASAEELYPARADNGLYGYINGQGEWVIEPQFDWAGSFRGDYASFAEYPEGATEEDLWDMDCHGVIDRAGHVVLEPVYTLESGMSGDYFGGWDTGIWTVDQYESDDALAGWFDVQSGYFSGLNWGMVWHWVSDSRLIPVESAETYQCGYADRTTGELVIPCLYDSFMPSTFEDGVAAVQLTDEEGEYLGDAFLIDEAGQTIPLPEGYFCYLGGSGVQGRIPVYNEQELIGFVDTAGKLVVPAQFHAANDFSDGFAAVKFSEDECGFIGLDGSVLARGFDDVDSFRSGYARVEKDGEVRYLRTDGSFAPFTGDGYRFFSETRGWYRLDPERCSSDVHLVNEQGEILTEQPVHLMEMEPSSFEGGLQAVRIDGKYGFIDLDGQVVIPCIYSSAENFDGDLARVRQGDRVGYIDRAGNEVYMWDDPDWY